MHNTGTKSTPHYRVWVYCFNSIMLVLQVLFVFSAWRVFRHEWMILFPFSATDLSVIYLYVAFSLQFFACLCGIWAVYRSNRYVLRLFYMLLIPLMLGDMFIGLIWAIRFRLLHLNYSNFLTSLWTEQVGINAQQVTTSFCDIWDDIQQSYQCCGPLGFEQLPHLLINYCGQQLNGTMIPPSCCPQPSLDGCSAESAFQLACDKPLLKWYHSQADLLSIIGYWCLFPLKLIFVVVLRQELAEIFLEIYKEGNQELFRHWADDYQANRTDSNDANGSDYGNGSDIQDDHNGTSENDSHKLLAQTQSVQFRIEMTPSETDLT
uniref:Tetraspanin n=1 Tax=Plectus sambesii TaxID=2011161 RepID=A0A914VYB4_9BILA